MATLPECERASPSTVTLNNSVEYLPIQYLPSPKLARKQQTIVTTLCEELQASN